jgi:aspartate 1-decarboxylase
VQRQMLKSKIHRAAVTGCDPDYVGSITPDPELMRSADLLANEQVDLDSYAPIVVHVGERNEIVRVDSHPEVLLDSSLVSEADFEVPGNLIHEGSYR